MSKEILVETWMDDELLVVILTAIPTAVTGYYGYMTR